MLLGPAGDRAGAGYAPAGVGDGDRDLGGAGERADLGPVLLAAAPGPGHQPVTADGLDLVLIARGVERVPRLGTGVGEAGAGGLGSTRVEDHRPQTTRRRTDRARGFIYARSASTRSKISGRWV